jgi:hypothetical protein
VVTGIQPVPALNNLSIRPGSGFTDVDVQYNVVVIGHDGIGTYIKCVHPGQFHYPVFNPAAPVFVVVAGMLVTSA